MATPEQAAPWVVAALTSLAGGGGLWGWLNTRAKLKAAAPADLATAYASFAKTLNDQAEAFIKTLQAERADLVGQMHGLRLDLDRLSQEHEECLGENRQLRQRLDSLERKMNLPGALVVLKDDGATITMPATPPER